MYRADWKPLNSFFPYSAALKSIQSACGSIKSASSCISQSENSVLTVGPHNMMAIYLQ